MGRCSGDTVQELQRWCRYIGHVAHVLQGLQGSLPERAAPVATDLVAQIERGQEKCRKYETRSGIEGVLRAKNEAVRTALTSCHWCSAAELQLVTHRAQIYESWEYSAGWP